MPCGGINPGIICSTPTPSSLANDAFASLADALAKGFGKAVELSLTFWVHVPTPQLSDTSGPVGNLRGATAWLTGAVAVAALLTAAIRLAIVAKPEPAMDAARGLVTLIVASAVGVPAIAAATVAGDAFSTWILDKAGNGALGARLTVLAGAMPALGSGLVFIIAILGILAAFAQIALMLIRVGVLVMLTGILPLVAAGSGTRTGRATFQKVLSWLLAFVLYKPAAAIVYASAFWLIGEGKDAVQVLSGLALMMLAILALPALLRLLTPAVASATSGGGGGAAVAGGVVIATGARAITHGSGAAPPSSAPTGATATTGKTASGAAAGAGAAAAGAAGGGAAAAPVVGLVAQGASAAKQAADGATGGGGSPSNGSNPNSSP
jgi:type IV secretion system protein TrbL